MSSSGINRNSTGSSSITPSEPGNGQHRGLQVNATTVNNLLPAYEGTTASQAAKSFSVVDNQVKQKIIEFDTLVETYVIPELYPDNIRTIIILLNDQYNQYTGNDETNKLKACLSILVKDHGPDQAMIKLIKVLSESLLKRNDIIDNIKDHSNLLAINNPVKQVTGENVAKLETNIPVKQPNGKNVAKLETNIPVKQPNGKNVAKLKTNNPVTQEKYHAPNKDPLSKDAFSFVSWGNHIKEDPKHTALFYEVLKEVIELLDEADREIIIPPLSTKVITQQVITDFSKETLQRLCQTILMEQGPKETLTLLEEIISFNSFNKVKYICHRLEDAANTM